MTTEENYNAAQAGLDEVAALLAAVQEQSGGLVPPDVAAILRDDTAHRLAKAQVHATLAVADEVRAVREALSRMSENR